MLPESAVILCKADLTLKNWSRSKLVLWQNLGPTGGQATAEELQDVHFNCSASGNGDNPYKEVMTRAVAPVFSIIGFSKGLIGCHLPPNPSGFYVTYCNDYGSKRPVTPEVASSSLVAPATTIRNHR